MFKKVLKKNNILLRSFPLLVVISIALVLFSSRSEAELVDRVVAVVNNDVITLSELDEEAEDYLKKTQEFVDEGELKEVRDKVRAQVLDQLIDQRIINQQAKIARVTISEQEFERIYQKNLESMGISEDVFLEELSEAGMTLATFEKSLRNKVLRDKLIMHEIQSKIIVTEEMILDYYNTVHVNTGSQKTYDLLQMGFVYGQSENMQNSPDLLEADKARALLKANEVHRKVMEGEDFAVLAREYSDLPSAEDGGHLGFLSLEDMADYMKEPILMLTTGELTPVIETPIGYQFFKLLATQEEGSITNVVPYFEVKEEIRQTLFEKELEKEYTNWVEEMREKTYIKNML